MTDRGPSGDAGLAGGAYYVARGGYAVNGGGPDMTKRVNRLMEIAIVGYIVISVTQVLVTGASPAPDWLASVTQVIGGG